MQKCRNPHPLASNLLGLRIRLLIASTAQSLAHCVKDSFAVMGSIEYTASGALK